MVDWARAWQPRIQQVIAKPDPTDEKNIGEIAARAAQCFFLYAPSGKGMTDYTMKSYEAQTQLRVQTIMRGLADYPAWAVKAAFDAWEDNPDTASFAPKTAGELVPLVKSAMLRSIKLNSAIKRILDSDKAGLNVDALQKQIDAAESDEKRGSKCLSAASILEASVDSLHCLPPEIRQKYDEWYEIGKSHARNFKPKFYNPRLDNDNPNSYLDTQT